MDGDLQQERPLCVAFDFNSSINCKVVGQTEEDRRSLNVVKSFYVKYERKLPELITDFCEYYRYFGNKEVIAYYDSAALGSNYAVNDQNFIWVICHEYEKQDWSVRPVPIGKPMAHIEKYLLINKGFVGQARRAIL